MADIQTPPPWLPGVWTIYSTHPDEGVAEMVDRTTGIVNLTKLSYSSIIVNNKETEAAKAWYKVGITSDGKSIEMFNPITGGVKLIPNPDPLPLSKPDKPINIKSNFAAPVEGVKAPETDKSVKVSSQRIANEAAAAVPTVTAPTVPSIAAVPTANAVTTISGTSVLEGAVIGTAITGDIGVGTVVGGIVGAVASCIEPPELPSYADKLKALEDSINGELKKLEKTPFVQGLESIGEDIGDFVGDVDAWLTDAVGDISGFLDDAANSVSNLLDDVMGAITTEVNKLPDPSEIFGIEGIPCPGTVKKDKEDAQAKADAAVAKEEETNSEADAKVAAKAEATAAVIKNLDKAGIDWKLDKDGIPRMNVKKEISKGNLPLNDREASFAIVTLYEPLWVWTKEYSNKRWESNCYVGAAPFHPVCDGSKAASELRTT